MSNIQREIITINDELSAESSSDSSDRTDSDKTHWGGFRVGDEITPLEGDTSGIMKAVAPVANKVIHNPNTSAPKSPELAHTLTMAPSAPSMGGMGGGGGVMPPRRMPQATVNKNISKNDVDGGIDNA